MIGSLYTPVENWWYVIVNMIKSSSSKRQQLDVPLDTPRLNLKGNPVKSSHHRPMINSDFRMNIPVGTNYQSVAKDSSLSSVHADSCGIMSS